MSHDTQTTFKLPIAAPAAAPASASAADTGTRTGELDPLTEVLREGARRLLTQAIQAEVDEHIIAHAQERDAISGHRLVVRNGYMPARTIQTPLGPLEVRQPRVDDRRLELDEPGQRQRLRFTSKILPRYLRRTKTIDQLIPWLYLKGVSTGDFAEALAALLGHEPKNLSANTVMRLKEVWRQEWEAWSARSLEGKRYVYFWADGIYFNIRLEDQVNNRQCILVIIGATDTGKKELVAIAEGYRESEQSWLDLLRELRSRGLEHGPQLATGDGALGFWKALRQVYPQAREQRCWMHKTANVLTKLPQGQQETAKRKLQAIWMAETQAAATDALGAFASLYRDKYPKAVTCLEKDAEALLAFYAFPAQHWVHLRTTNPIESTFATVRLRTDKTKGGGTRQACLTMVFKLCQSAERHWRPLNGCDLLPDVIEGVPFVDGIRQAA